MPEHGVSAFVWLILLMITMHTSMYVYIRFILFMKDTLKLKGSCSKSKFFARHT